MDFGDFPDIKELDIHQLDVEKIKKEVDEDNYEDSRKSFYKLVDEIRAFETTLKENQEIHSFINGIEFRLEKISLIRIRSGALSALLAFSGVRLNGETFLHVQTLNSLNLSLSASHIEDATSLRRKLVIEEFDQD